MPASFRLMICRSKVSLAFWPAKQFLIFAGKIVFLCFSACFVEWITVETNRYEQQQRIARAIKIREAQRRNKVSDPSTVQVSVADIKVRMRMSTPLGTHEFVRVMGFLLANTLCSHVRGIHHHWKMGTVGAISGGSFGLTMSRNRFTVVLQHLYFADNNNKNEVRDKEWKIRRITRYFSRRVGLDSLVVVWRGCTPTHVKNEHHANVHAR